MAAVVVDLCRRLLVVCDLIVVATVLFRSRSFFFRIIRGLSRVCLSNYPYLVWALIYCNILISVVLAAFHGDHNSKCTIPVTPPPVASSRGPEKPSMNFRTGSLCNQRVTSQIRIALAETRICFRFHHTQSRAMASLPTILIIYLLGQTTT